MKKQLCIFSLLVILGITAIQLIPILDDPNHLMRPDPDCPMCMAFQTHVLPGHTVCIGTIVLNVAIIAETYVFNKYSQPFIPIYTIRAPPSSYFFAN